MYRDGERDREREREKERETEERESLLHSSAKEIPNTILSYGFVLNFEFGSNEPFLLTT